MRLQDLGCEIRKARLTRGLTQAQLADAAGLSRTTLNQLENGLFPDIGVKKALAILNKLGLDLSLQLAAKTRRPDFIAMACTTASVSYREILNPDELIHALLSGRAPPNRRVHIRTLFDEAPTPLLQGLAEDVARWTKPGRLERNLRKLAIDLGATHGVERWLKTG